MNKRLRKKKHKGEYCEWGSEFNVTLKNEDLFDSFLDDFIQRVEDLNCYCAGGGKGTSLSLVVGLGVARDEKFETNHKQLMQWVSSHSAVESFNSSPLFDMWYGPYPSNDF